jgi:release factor glutamine methyltransferase
MSGEPYLASEDSALLREALRSYDGESCLEIGAGNAGNLIDLAGRFALVVGTDVVKPSMRDWKSAGANYVLADVASCLGDSTVELVAFNPPYLAAAEAEDRAVGGGTELEVAVRFLRDALRVVKRSGRVVMLLNDGADPELFEEVCSSVGFTMRRVAARRVFFEELVVYEASAKGADPARASTGVGGAEGLR